MEVLVVGNSLSFCLVLVLSIQTIKYLIALSFYESLHSCYCFTPSFQVLLFREFCIREGKKPFHHLYSFLMAAVDIDLERIEFSRLKLKQGAEYSIKFSHTFQENLIVLTKLLKII